MRGLVVIALLAAACGGSVTGPTPVEPPQDNPLPPLAPVPQTGFGFFVQGRDIENERIPGNIHILLLSWGDDVERIARNMRGNGQVGLVSTHCCLWGGGKFDASRWTRIEEEWLTPLRMHGVLAGIYLVDEPNGNGISVDNVVLGASHAENHGYPTFAATQWRFRRTVLPVSAQATTAYEWAGPGGTKKEYARDWYRENNEWIVGEAFNAGRGMRASTFEFWRETAELTRKPIINWVWRWPGQEGCGDSPVCRSVWQ